VLELLRAGYLAWIKAHLLSLGSLSRLMARMPGAAENGTADAAPTAA